MKNFIITLFLALFCTSIALAKPPSTPTPILPEESQTPNLFDFEAESSESVVPQTRVGGFYFGQKKETIKKTCSDFGFELVESTPADMSDKMKSLGIEFYDCDVNPKSARFKEKAMTGPVSIGLVMYQNVVRGFQLVYLTPPAIGKGMEVLLKNTVTVGEIEFETGDKAELRMNPDENWIGFLHESKTNKGQKVWLIHMEHTILSSAGAEE